MNNLLSVAEISASIVKNLSENLGIWYIIILNAFGVLAIICKVVEYQLKKRNLAFLLAMTSQLLWTAYFVISGDFISAVSCVITFASVSIFNLRKDHAWAKSVWWLIGFLAVQIALSVFTFKTWIDIFPLLAGVTGIFAYYSIDMKKYRAISFFYALAWLLNSISKGYILALFSDSFSLVSVSVAIVRYDFLGKKEQPKSEKE